MTKPEGFAITDGKGFHIKFLNGWTVSVQFGPGNYCEHYNRSIGKDEYTCGSEGSINAEIAAWPKGGTLTEFPDGNTVQGYVSPQQVLQFLIDVSLKEGA